MTVLSIQWLPARPRRPAVLTRSRRSVPLKRRTARLERRTARLERRTARLERRTYPDLFFADPVAVEDDSRRMLRRWS
jgi:hypothetical protein